MNAPLVPPVVGALARWRSHRRIAVAPFLCATISRGDVTIEFEATPLGDGDFAFTITDAYLDDGELAAAERAGLAEWLHGAGYDRACAEAIDYLSNI